MITANNQLTPPAQQSGSAYDMSSALLGGSADVYKNISEGGALQNINAYMNPFYDQVINSTLGRMDINRDKTMGMIGDQAEAAGAFGGSRHGIMEGEFLGQDQMNRTDMMSNLMAQNFGQASQAARGDLFGAAQGATQLGGQYYNIGNDIADRQMQAGTTQQDFLQQLLSGGEERFNEMIGQPSEIINLFAALNGQDPRANNISGTQSSTPGLFDYLSLAAGMGSAYLGAG